jgi:hypothetical protein
MEDGWQQATHSGTQSTTGADRERSIARIASRQHSLVSLPQLSNSGLSRSAVRSRLARGRLHRVIWGVYAIHPPPYSVRQRWMAAVLACGAGARLDGQSAGALQQIVEAPAATIHVCSPSRTGRTRSGVTVHRRTVDPRDARIVDSIPCVSADLVLIELAPGLDEAELEVVLVAAESKGLLKRGRLGELTAEQRGRPGIPKLERLLALEPAIARSELEPPMLRIARAAGIERPLVNHPVAVPQRSRPLVVDFAWPMLRMVVEADSQRFHGDWEHARADRERDQLLALAGWRCHRFVRDRLVLAPDECAERLRELAAVRSAEIGAVSCGGSARGER